MKKIRVLVVGLSNTIGGIESLFLNIVKFSADNIEYDFIIFDQSCQFEKELVEKGCQIYYLTRRGANPLKSAQEQKNFFEKYGHRYDFIWNNISSASDILIYLLSRKYTEAKIISHSHGVNFETDHMMKRFIHLALHKIQTKRLIDLTDFYFACSKDAGKWLFPTCSENSIVEMKNGIHVDDFTFSDRTRKLMRESLEVSDRLVLGHIGRLCKVKNQVFLIELIELLAASNQDVILLLIGEGEDEGMLRDLVSKKGLEQNVRFLGIRKDVNEILHAVDVFLLPSLFEGFPLSLVEAQASGVNCIVSDTITADVDLTNLIEFKTIGSNHSEWKDYILSLNLHPENRSQYAVKVKKSGFDIKDTVHYIEHYLLENSRRGEME